MKALSSHAHWLLRIGVSAVFLFHGLPKFMMAGQMADMMGMSEIMVYLIALAEVGGVLLLLIGGFGPDWMTRLGGLFHAIIMVGAIAMVHWQHGWNSINMGEATPNEGKGFEFQFVLLMISLFFMIRGNDCKLPRIA